MKKTIAIIALVCCTALQMTAQTLNIQQGQVVYAIPASQAGSMTYQDGIISIMNKNYDVNAISSMVVDESQVTDNTVKVSYNGETATVTIAGNIAHLVNAEVSGAHVTIEQLTTADATEGSEITYTLSGTTGNGSFYMDGEYKATLELNNVSINNQDSAAINIQDGKRIKVVLTDGTTSTLRDEYLSGISTTEQDLDCHNACFYVQGHTEMEGTGTLNVYGQMKHAFTSNEYCEVKTNATLNLNSTNGDAMHIGQYFHLMAGSITATAYGDGLDLSKKKDTTKEQNGEIIIDGGNLDITTTGGGSKTIKGEGTFVMNDGTLTLLAMGDGGKLLSTDGSITINGGSLTGFTTGNILGAGTDDESKPHALKSDSDIAINGGTVMVAASEEDGKAFKTDYKLLINGGTIMGIGAKKSSPASASQQGYKMYSDQVIKAGSSYTKDGVTFTISDAYSNSDAKVLVSKAGM